MDLVVLYTSSPDWIKALMVILPHASLLGIAWLFLRRPQPSPPPMPAQHPLSEVTARSRSVVDVHPGPVRLDLALHDLELQDLELQALERREPDRLARDK